MLRLIYFSPEKKSFILLNNHGELLRSVQFFLMDQGLHKSTIKGVHIFLMRLTSTTKNNVAPKELAFFNTVLQKEQCCTKRACTSS